MMGKKKCELCGGIARVFCESDEASLCWGCDAKVHGANFLVAKHVRCLLCSACQSPTPWKASGLRLCATISICESCLARKKRVRHCDGVREDDGVESYEERDPDTMEEEEAENQVVPAQQLPTLSSQDLKTRLISDLNFSHEEESTESSRPFKRLSRDETSSTLSLRINGERRSNGCRTSSSSSTILLKVGNKRRDLSH